jgi:FkbM family methyltransferase
MTIDGNRHAITMSDHTELAGAVEVFVSGDYDIGASSDDVRRVIDLGANVGFATHYMRSRYPDAEIVALEPAPDAYRRLAANVEHLGWVTTLPLAIGVPGWVRMDLSLPSPERSPVSTDDAQGIRRISLQSLLVMLGWDEVDVLKVDIEGDEFMVLADTDTVQRARIVVGELHMDRAPPDFAGVETLLPGFVVDTISRSAGTAIFRAVRRNSLPGGAS